MDKTLGKKRLMVFVAAVLLWQLGVLGRVFFLKVFRCDYYEQKAKAQKEEIIDVTAPRGRILDCRLEPLAVSLPFDSVYVYAPNVSRKEKTATALAAALKMGQADVLGRMTSNLKFRYIKRFIETEESDRIRELNLDGVGVVSESKRVYPNNSLASHLLGIVTFRDGRERGEEGVEKRYEDYLLGKPGRLLILRDGLSNVITTQQIEPAKPGQTVVLNLDSEIQYVVEKELSAAMKTNGAKSGMVVVMEPSSGRVLAMAVSPDFDPGKLDGASTSNLRNLSVERYFEPGSTFKIVATSGTLERDLASPEEVIYCNNGSIVIAGHVIRDHKPFGLLTFPQILANSSDVGAIKLGMRLGDEGMYGYVRAFGFGSRTGIDLPAELPGYVRDPSRWSKISIGAVSIGQEVGVTALQITRAMAVVAGGGLISRPLVVDRIVDDQGRVVFRQDPEQARVISEKTASIIRDALVEVVRQGTGKKAQVPGFNVGGKTGTAQKFDFQRRAYSETEFVASFVGFAPAENPMFVMSVVFDSPQPYHGGEAAAPVFSAIARQILLLRHITPTEAMPQVVEKNRAVKEDPTSYVDFRGVIAQSPTVGKAVEEEPSSAVTIYADGAPVVPDFRGKSMKAMLRECERLGLVLEPSGSGIASEQSPRPGARIAPGGRVRVVLVGPARTKGVPVETAAAAVAPASVSR